MIKKILILFLFAVTLQACTNSEVREESQGITRILTESNFETIDSVEYSIPKGIEGYLINARFIEASDSLLLIVDNNDENIFQFFDLITFNKVGSFGRKGEGPGEVSTPVFINHNSFIKNDRF